MMGSPAIGSLRAARQRILDAHPSASDPVNIWFSGTSCALWRAAAGMTREAARGLVLDAGSGRGGWSAVIEGAGARREALDIAERPGVPLDWVADLTAMPQVPSGRFDAAVCHQVLEHVPRPQDALRELARVLKPGGRLVLSVPHLSRLHDLPHDYFRFTGQGLAVLVAGAGLELVVLRRFGGIATFLHHQFSTLFLGLAALSGPAYPLFVALNAPLTLLALGFDRLTDRGGLAPNGYVLLARKPGEPAGGPG